MTWADARGKVRDLLSAVEITEPLALTVRHVYEFPPKAIEAGDIPCFVMIPPRREQEWGPAYARIRTYTMRIQCLVRDEQADDAANICDAFAESVMDVLIPSIRLDNVDAALTIATGPQIEEPSGFTYGVTPFLGFEMHLTFRYDTNESFAP